MTWEKGRQLKSFDTNTYTYNVNGIRTGKQTQKLRRNLFITEGSKLVYEDRNWDSLVPLYDNEGNICGIRYYSENYFFQKNLQGDIIAIKNQKGEIVARYRYDAWGVPTIVEDISTNDEDWDGDGIATVNPFRYRGYYYDNETGLYYLQSRYYDPTIGRFINADSTDYLGSINCILSNNLYSYCENNSINKSDNTGFAPLRFIGFGFQIELSVSIVTVGIELVWFTDSSIRNGRTWYIPYIYLYGGGGISGDLRSIISKISKNPSLLFNPKKIARFSGSISIFAIWGYPNFKKPKSYEGWFSGVSATLWHIKAYTSWCSTCFVVGIGVSTSTFGASSGATYYKLSSEVFSGLSNVYNNVSKKAKTIKK